MRLEDQVTNLELSRNLCELGVKQEGIFCWARQSGYKNWGLELYSSNPELKGQGRDMYIAFTVGELGEMLPNGINSFKGCVGWKWECTADLNGDGYITSSAGETEANARAKMLIYLIQHDLLKMENINGII